jgi:hypothetical protein
VGHATRSPRPRRRRLFQRSRYRPAPAWRARHHSARNGRGPPRGAGHTGDSGRARATPAAPAGATARPGRTPARTATSRRFGREQRYRGGPGENRSPPRQPPTTASGQRSRQPGPVARSPPVRRPGRDPGPSTREAHTAPSSPYPCLLCLPSADTGGLRSGRRSRPAACQAPAVPGRRRIPGAGAAAGSDGPPRGRRRCIPRRGWAWSCSPRHPGTKPARTRRHSAAGRPPG